MPRRILLIVMLSLPVVLLAVVYAATVRRGPFGMREELAWEVAAAGHVPVRTRIFAEQRVPEYPRRLRWLAPAFADVHALDVRLRWAYWHEEVAPEFDHAPDFELARR